MYCYTQHDDGGEKNKKPAVSYSVLCFAGNYYDPCVIKIMHFLLRNYAFFCL